MRSRKFFYISTCLIATTALIIQIIQISSNDFNASFLSQHDEYWTIYYNKPWARIHGYLIGVLIGCNYFTFKYERDENGNELHPSKLSKLFTAMREDNKIMLPMNMGGSLVMFVVCMYCRSVNLKGDKISVGGNLLYLLFSRPLYITGWTMYVMPYVLKNRMLSMVRGLLIHRYFVPYAKLTYGVFLCNSIFMQFRAFNLENGVWA